MYNQKEVFVEYSVCSNLSIMESNLNESYEEENILYEANINYNLTNRNSVTEDIPYHSLGDVNNNNLTNRNSVTEDIPYDSLGDVNDNMIRMVCTQNLEEPLSIFKELRLKNPNRIIIGHLNINSIRNKFEELKLLVKDSLDLIIITETKIDNSFIINQFLIDGFSMPFRADRDKHGGGILVYIRESINARLLEIHNDIEGIFFEINLRNRKWFICATYNPHKNLCKTFFECLTCSIEQYLSRYDNILIIGDFNTEVDNSAMQNFLLNFDLASLVKDPTCFKNPTNPSCIDLFLTNRKGYFKNTIVT